MKSQKAFTLIELLIVVAIIAILAAIAVPNFLEAQVRSKVSRVKADMRSIAVGLDSYMVDNNKYPPDYNYAFYHHLPVPPFVKDWYCDSLTCITTPIAYMTSMNLPDPFFTHQGTAVGEPGPTRSYKYFNTGYCDGSGGQGNWGDAVGAANPTIPLPTIGYILTSYGPDRAYQAGEWVAAGLNYSVGGWLGVDRLYDPTNGTTSAGDLVRMGGGASDSKR